MLIIILSWYVLICVFKHLMFKLCIDHLTAIFNVSTRISSVTPHFDFISIIRFKTIAWLIVDKFAIEFKFGIISLALRSARCVCLLVRKGNRSEKYFTACLSNVSCIISAAYDILFDGRIHRLCGEELYSFIHSIS